MKYYGKPVVKLVPKVGDERPKKTPFFDRLMMLAPWTWGSASKEPRKGKP